MASKRTKVESSATDDDIQNKKMKPILRTQLRESAVITWTNPDQSDQSFPKILHAQQVWWSEPNDPLEKTAPVFREWELQMLDGDNKKQAIWLFNKARTDYDKSVPTPHHLLGHFDKVNISNDARQTGVGKFLKRFEYLPVGNSNTIELDLAEPILTSFGKDQRGKIHRHYVSYLGDAIKSCNYDITAFYPISLLQFAEAGMDDPERNYKKIQMGGRKKNATAHSGPRTITSNGETSPIPNGTSSNHSTPKLPAAKTSKSRPASFVTPATPLSQPPVFGPMSAIGRVDGGYISKWLDLDRHMPDDELPFVAAALVEVNDWKDPPSEKILRSSRKFAKDIFYGLQTPLEAPEMLLHMNTQPKSANGYFSTNEDVPPITGSLATFLSPDFHDSRL